MDSTTGLCSTSTKDCAKSGVVHAQAKSITPKQFVIGLQGRHLSSGAGGSHEHSVAPRKKAASRLEIFELTAIRTVQELDERNH